MGELADDPYLSGRSGTLGRRARLRGALLDGAADALTAPERRGVRRRAGSEPPPRRVLALGVQRPEHARRTRALRAALARSRHHVTIRFGPGRPGAGKWENVGDLLADAAPTTFDWLLVLDDDVVLPRNFLDSFLLLAEAAALRIAQPAHRFDSHAAWPVTRRRPGVLVRETAFVEIGPVTALHRTTFPALLPFPPLKMGWGLDAHWSAVARARGWPIGVVDAVPMRHTRPVAAAYAHAEAVAEARAFLAGRPWVGRAEAARTLRAHRFLP